MAGWHPSMNAYVSVCPACGNSFVPYFTIDMGEPLQVEWISPATLMKEVLNMTSEGDQTLLRLSPRVEQHRIVYWNMVYYFKLLKFGAFVMDGCYETEHVSRQVLRLEIHEPEPKAKRGSSLVKLSSHALSMLNNDQKFNRPPSMVEGSVGNNSFVADSS